MPSTQSIIQFGLKLLREGLLEANELKSYSDAFDILKIDVSKPLKLAALKSVFSDPFDPSYCSAKYYKPSVLDSKDIIYPCDDTPGIDFSCLEKATETGGNALTKLEKYGSFVATDSEAHSQTPVYDLFKTAAAIDDCLKTDEGEEKFLLVGCDFSGIQDTVYTITSKGALKTLRARSFMLELLTEHIIHEILAAVHSGQHAVIYSGGGGFGLLLPNKKATRAIIEKYRKTLNDWALDEFMARFFIALDALPLSGEKLKNDFQNQRQLQADNLDKLKRTKFVDQLSKLFTPTMPEQVTVNTECQITRRDDLPDGQMRDIGLIDGEIMSKDNKNEDGRVWVSESCFHQFKLGDHLIGAKYIYRFENKLKNSGYLKLKGVDNKDIYYSVNTEERVTPAWQINTWEGDQPIILYADYVRTVGDLSEYAKGKEKEAAKEEGREIQYEHTASFTGLASSSCGADLIGALRMDVDNMGDMFSKIETVAELSAKSRMLNLFFKVYLGQICNGNLCGDLTPTDIVGKNYTEKKPTGENTGRNVSVIYAGGDDLFIIGAWDETTELAFDNKEPRRKQRGILKRILSYFTPQEAGNMTHRDSKDARALHSGMPDHLWRVNTSSIKVPALPDGKKIGRG